ncbi:type VI secretion system protein ImpG [Andreprevotia lacus DSM 23236]|jgi:type VI secretion system protein ImpG|uniref:Type VI secretion system protein ImpG n=1 Tax=Andreprevotia lacus DSM 23236 TaxID=1121001 RepID=A0A1W1XME0_9NEIS|nr:type VI secretion system baseplate subunit TssF [Andreprevotia lacus]SMC25015.1 type VI secretion system protein ImpG [Andreprevotia lacus DSM 23236]
MVNQRFLELYNQELRHVRETGREFAQQYPDIAARLGDFEGISDPYVERMVEAFAFLTARVQLKQESAFPQFTSQLLRCAYPNWGSPTPSMAIVAMAPSRAAAGLLEGYAIPRGTRLSSQSVPGIDGVCEFVTAQQVKVWPLAISACRYLPGRPQEAAHPSTQAKLEVTLEANTGADLTRMRIDDLCVHLTGADDVAGRLTEQVLGRSVAIRVSAPEGPEPRRFTELRLDALAPIGFRDDEAMLEHATAAFAGYRMLHEYFAFPQRFRYFRLAGAQLAQAIAKHAVNNRVNIVFYLSSSDASLAGAVDRDNLLLFTTPVINLFQRRTDRILVNQLATEYHVVPDRRRPLSYEVYDVLSLEGYAADANDFTRFAPLFAPADAREWAPSRAMFSLRRSPRLIQNLSGAQAQLGNYRYSDVFVSLVDRDNVPYRNDLAQIGGDILVTNGALPILCPKGSSHDLAMTDSAPVDGIRFIAGPTEPSSALAEGDTPWRLINLLSLNYLYLHDQTEGAAAAAVKELLSLHALLVSGRNHAHAQALQQVQTRVVTRPYPGGGPIVYARGVKVDLTFDEMPFGGSSAFVLGLVMQHYLKQHAHLNSFVETTLHGLGRKDIKTWPAQLGHKGLI